jgi:hypothetical protein
MKKIIRNLPGNKKQEVWVDENGKFHRDKFPAIITRNSRDEIIEKKWYKHGNNFRPDDKPSIIEYKLSDITKENKTTEIWTRPDGKIGRDGDKPSIIKYDNYRNKEQAIWQEDRKKYRAGDKPADIMYRPAGGKLQEIWYEPNGKVGRSNGKPAIIHYSKNDGKTPVQKIWKRNGKIYRDDDKPSIVTFSGATGIKNREEWINENNETHRDGDKPAIIVYNDDGILVQKIWNKKNKIHRIDGPANVLYWRNGTPRSESWYRAGILHRDGDKPSEMEYYNDGTIEYEGWKEGDKYIERPNDKPSSIAYNKNGSLQSERWMGSLETNEASRISGPAVRLYNNGKLFEEQWKYKGKDYEDKKAFLKENAVEYIRANVKHNSKNMELAIIDALDSIC